MHEISPRLRTLLLILSTATSFVVGTSLADDWPWWRGPYRNGHANPNQNPPLNWSDDQNIAWKTAIPGKGHGCPIIVGDRLYLATAVEEQQTRSLICLDRVTGEQIWETIVHRGKATPPRNKKGTEASSTPACDGDRLFINFLHDGAAYTSCVDLDGELLWQKKITDYTVHQGYGSSPLLYDDLVIVSADNKGGGAIAALRRSDGETVWKIDRPEKPNYSSPVIVEASGSDQLIMTGCDMIASFNPLTGELNWEAPGATTECVTTTITTGDLIFTTGGYPKNHVSAVRTDGSGSVAWENGVRVYVPSMVHHNDHLFAVTDAGVAMCWDANTGDERWKGRLGGTFSSSPVLVNDRIYVTNEEGETFVFAASTEKFELLAKNQLGDICFATPAICDGRIYTRIAEMNGQDRQEFVVCISEKD